MAAARSRRRAKFTNGGHIMAQRAAWLHFVTRTSSSMDCSSRIFDDDRTKSTVRRGYYHNWVGADLIRMLVASELAIRTSKGALRIPGGLRSLRVADAVRVTASRGLTTAKAAHEAANSAQHGLWEWYSYPLQIRAIRVL